MSCCGQTFRRAVGSAQFGEDGNRGRVAFKYRNERLLSFLPPFPSPSLSNPSQSSSLSAMLTRGVSRISRRALPRNALFSTATLASRAVLPKATPSSNTPRVAPKASAPAGAYILLSLAFKASLKSCSLLTYCISKICRSSVHVSIFPPNTSPQLRDRGQGHRWHHQNRHWCRRRCPVRQ